MSKYILLQVNIEKDEDAYTASCPALPGCVSWGKTYNKAYQNIQDAITCHMEAMDKLKQSKHLFQSAGRYVKELKHPSVVAFLEHASATP